MQMQAWSVAVVSFVAVAACGRTNSSMTAASPAVSAGVPRTANSAPATAAPPVTTNASVRVADTIPMGTAAQAAKMLVDLRSLDSSIVVDMRYRNKTNFMGGTLPGYEGNRALMRREAAEALVRVQTSLKEHGLGLKIWDAYRPVRATLAMVAWTQLMHREDLVTNGYIADRSKHNLGTAVDLTLVRLNSRTREELDMGTPHDEFSSAAHTANATGSILAQREMLVEFMEKQNFVNYEQEWWHFSFAVTNPLRFDIIITK